MITNDGGPAFPSPGVVLHNGHQQGAYEGMTLRDYFAAKAMGGFAADPNYGGSCKEMAEWAYKWADAMLAERER